MDDDFNKYEALPGVATASLVVINPYFKNLLVLQFHYTGVGTKISTNFFENIDKFN